MTAYLALMCKCGHRLGEHAPRHEAVFLPNGFVGEVEYMKCFGGGCNGDRHSFERAPDSGGQ